MVGSIHFSALYLYMIKIENIWGKWYLLYFLKKVILDDHFRKSKINKQFHFRFPLKISWAIYYTIKIEYTGKHKYS